MTIATAAAIPVRPGATGGIEVTRAGALLRITLDRPAALNAIDSAMRTRLAAAVRDVARDVNVYAVVLDSRSERAFSVGGDVRELITQLAADPTTADAALADEYALNWQLECFSKPSVALVDGLVMGTGVGLSLYATHRVAGPGYAFAMPETAIGFFPDDGVAHALGRLPGWFGIYLGLTGRRIGRADALRHGLVTHCIAADHFDAIRTGLTAAEPVDPLLDGLHREPGPGILAGHEEVIEHAFSAPSMPEIVARLEAERDGGGAHADWCRDVLAELQQRSPLALAVTLRHIRDARALDLRQTLMIDHRLACRLIRRPDFAEGVRAALIDKDGRPHWSPDRIGDVTEAMVEACFAPLPGALILPTRQEMQVARV